MRCLIKKTWTLSLAALLGLSLFGGCGSDDPVEVDEQLDVEVLQSQEQRITNPQVEQNVIDTQVTGNTGLALDLLQVLPGLLGEQQNLFYSPYSISLALAMTYGGARGTTEQEMASALHFDLPQSELHPLFNYLDLELASRGQGAQGKDDQGFRLNIANSVWGQSGYPFEQDFLDLLALHYGAGLRLWDFGADPDGGRQTINRWVELKTEERIKDLIPEGSISDLTRMVLVNAIYFNAAWAEAFETSQTADQPFTLQDGSQVTVSMMNKTEELSYTQGAGFQAVEMAYDGEELGLLLVLPDEGQLTAVEQALTAAELQATVDALQPAEVELGLPKFKVEGASVSLKEALQELGMVQAFGGADFSGIADTGELYISDVLHKAFIEIDEAGTEAAAATAVVLDGRSAPLEAITVTLDRPFLFFIRDRATGSVLFVGRMLNPAA